MSDVKTDPTPAARSLTRRYESPRRAAQAAGTRRRILTAARRLFAEQGLSTTTIADIARAAASSPQTVYATFGSKVGLLLAILDELTATAGLEAVQRQLGDATHEPRRVLALYVRFDRRLFEAGSELIGVGLGLRAADPEIGAWFAEGERRRRANQARYIRAWHAAGLLRPGLSERRAADILWSLTGPAVYDLLVTQARWSPSAYERWLTDLLESQLFGEPGEAGEPGRPGQRDESGRR